MHSNLGSGNYHERASGDPLLKGSKIGCNKTRSLLLLPENTVNVAGSTEDADDLNPILDRAVKDQMMLKAAVVNGGGHPSAPTAAPYDAGAGRHLGGG